MKIANIPIDIELLPDYSKKVLENFIRNKDVFEDYSIIFDGTYSQKMIILIDDVETIIDNKTFSSEKKILLTEINKLINTLDLLLKQSEKYISKINTNLINIKELQEDISSYKLNSIYTNVENFKKFLNTHSKQLIINNMPGHIHLDLEETINKLCSSKLMFTSLELSPVLFENEDKNKIMELWQIIETIHFISIKLNSNISELFSFDYIMNEIMKNEFLYPNYLKKVS